MKILVTGLCTLHWGRLEYGNIGNYYIVEPFFRELHRVFPEAEIVTTFQMTDEFCERENVKLLPMDIYYSWSDDDVDIALKEYGISEIYSKTGQLVETTPYLDEVISSDMVIDISGEMWGDKANPVGNNRMLVNLLKMRVAQLLKKPTVLYAVSAGPFNDVKTSELAKITFESFSLVTIREPETTKRLRSIGFNIDNTKQFPCTSYLFQPADVNKAESILKSEQIMNSQKPIIGMIVCGFNLTLPYDKWPRDDKEYNEFALVIEYIVNNLGARVVLMSHSNGFDLPPNFKLKPGRDYNVIKQLQEVVAKRQIVKDMKDVLCINNAYIPKETKAIIGQFDMLVTGRVHASVASVSQCIPTVFVTYEKEEDTGKTLGFASLSGLQDYVAKPNANDMIKKIEDCFNNKEKIAESLKERIPVVQDITKKGIDALKELL
ncbi:polysaccharide pyruvyl transferase family protein [Alkaliphilus sp. MSJ-5]|uniref:Polysaccharide pyruvyl transferase family protein n=1 Tax=Alkaliphilus flagellatus TaxID=2841507 RepID=A0ABS6G2G2_9FIRM|nr:polysaccharide pyruvyl transferase family protein [Alkaliphilus flagellatus]MBU5676670.1 polysaccharide pyruvyl transferase family protein [Alkaliphilus flagellatus]